MTYPALTAADALIRIANERGKGVSNLELQKLLYFAHGWNLALTQEPLISEKFEAWRFGPVISSLYHKFKLYSANPIPVDHAFKRLLSAEIPAEDVHTPKLLEKILDVYGAFSGKELIALSHTEDSPWHPVYHDRNDRSGVIPNDRIQQYFVDLAAADNV